MTTFFRDTFTEASTTLVTSHTSDSGGSWVYWAGGTPAPSIYTILGGVLGSGSTTAQVYRGSVICPTADVIVAGVANAQISPPQLVHGLCARLDAGGTAGYVAAYVGSTQQWGIYRIGSALATTSLGTQTGTTTYSIGDTPSVSFKVTGSGATVSLELTVNGVVVVSATDTSGSRITAAGYAGIWFNTNGTSATNWFWNSFQADDLAASTSHTITTPVAGTIRQLSGGASGTASIALAGTYTGTAPNQWRLVQDGTNTPVSGFDWTSFSVAPSAGAFSQTIASIPKQSGWLNVQVRDSGGAGSATSGKVGTGVLVVVDGQSWSWLWFSATAYAGDSTLTADSLLRITGKQASNAWVAPASATMNAAIACGNALVAACGCPVGLVDGSWDASGLTIAGGSGASGPNGRWITSGAAGNALTSSDAAITAAGGSVAATIWIQGQGDAGSSVSQSTYYTAFGQMTTLRRTAQGSTHPYVIVTHPRYTAGLTDGQVEAIRKAHVQACADAHNFRVDSIDLPLHTDGVHATAAGFTTLGRRCAQAVLAALGLVTYYRGPQIASVDQISSTVYDVNLAHNAAATDFTPSASITGFRALVSGTPATISSAARQSATKIRLTLSASAASPPVVDYLYGAAPTISGVVLDNSTLTLPLEYNSGVSAAQAESFTPADSSNGTVTSGTAPELESFTPTDSSSAQHATAGAGNNTLTLADALGAVLVTSAAQLETAGLAETTTAYVTKFAAQAESITISDAWAATLIQLGTLSPGTRIIKRGHYDRAITREPNRLVPLEVGETDVLTFDYTDRLVDAETIVSAVTTISVVNGTDPSPSGLLVGTTQVTTPYALQKVTGAVRNVTYLCYCAATTSTGRVLVNAGLLPVIAFGQP